MTAVQQASPMATSSRRSLLREEGSGADMAERAASPVLGLWDPSMRARHPADRGPAVQRSESPAQELWAGESSPLPTFEESQRHTRQSKDEGAFSSVASGPLAKISMDAEASRAQVNENSPVPASSNKRSFLSSLLSPRASSSSPKTSPVPDRTNKSPTTSQSGMPRSATQPDGLGLGIGPMPAAPVKQTRPSTSHVPMSKSSPADLASQDKKPASVADLAAVGLSMSTLTVPLQIAKTPVPTCGVVLDSKYLLLGHSMGLDFLPLDPSVAAKVKTPISLIKKTRFRQLMILEERSNVLLAIAGRNDHVRVYALDGMRSTIEKKLKEVLPFEPFVASTKRPATAAASMQRPLTAKGKGRADPPAPLQNVHKRHSSLKGIPNSPPPPYRKPSLVPVSPARNSFGSVVTALPTQSTGSLRTSRSGETIVAARRPSAVALGKRRASNASTRQLYATAVSRQESQSGTEEDDWMDAAMPEPASPLVSGAPKLEARSASVTDISMAADLKELLESEPPAVAHSSNAPRSPRSSPVQRTRRSSRDLLSFKGSPSMSEVGKRSPVANGMKRDASQSSIGSGVFSSLTLNRLQPRSPVSDAGSEDSRALMEFLEQPPSPTMARMSKAPKPARSASRDGLSGALANFLFDNDAALPALAEPASPRTSVPSPRPKTAPMIARSASMDVEVERASNRDLAALLRDGPPEASLSPADNQLERTTSRASSTSWRTETASPVPGMRDSMASFVDATAQETEEDTLLPRPRPEPEEQSGARQRKRWSMLDALRPNSSAGIPTTAPAPTRHRRSSEDPIPADATVLAVVGTSLSRPTLATASGSRSGKAHIARPSADDLTSITAGPNNDPLAANFAKAEVHPASAMAPLDYVKLARTKGAKMLKGAETHKKTYLAVLCGDGAERIELFTGARNVSLSLNRTFVLPESPRSIEFQLQGDELVDIYLLYDESIFALEPATVRVREVGVARNERRAARRERDRDRQARLEAGLPPVPVEDYPSRHHRSQSSPAAGQEATTEAPIPAATDEAVSSIVETSSPMQQKPRPPPAECFTVWQQLPFIPPVPPSVLASSFVIPPTYDAVLASTPQPKQEGFAGAEPDPSPVEQEAPFKNFNIPLLSPISLLANHPSRHSGPPGLFFISRGRHMTNIVDGDGRSVIRRAIKWDLSRSVDAEKSFAHLDVFSHMEMLVVGGRKTVLVAFGPTQVQAIEVGPKPGAIHLGGDAPPAESFEVSPRGQPTLDELRDVTYLGKAGETVLWTERSGTTYTIHSLSARL